MFRIRFFFWGGCGALFMLAGSCGEDTQMQQRLIQGRIDSAVHSRLGEERLRLQARNDSLIVQEARRRADSLHAAGE